MRVNLSAYRLPLPSPALPDHLARDDHDQGSISHGRGPQDDLLPFAHARVGVELRAPVPDQGKAKAVELDRGRSAPGQIESEGFDSVLELHHPIRLAVGA